MSTRVRKPGEFFWINIMPLEAETSKAFLNIAGIKSPQGVHFHVIKPTM